MQPIFQTEQNVTKYLELETFEKNLIKKKLLLLSNFYY